MEPKTAPSYTWILAVALILALALIGVGLWLAIERAEFSLLASGALALIATLAVAAVALNQSAHRRSQQSLLEETATDVRDRLQQFSVMLNQMSEQQLLSDRAKSVAFREKDREALRRAIVEEMAAQDYEAALALVQDMENAFGYRQEAVRFREEITAKRDEAIRRVVNEQLQSIDRLTKAEKWGDAHREAQRIMQQFNGNPMVANLPQEIEARRQSQKGRLLASLNDAVARKDIDAAVEILKQLDTYLTPQEAEGISETARNVFKERLTRLREQFGAAVHNQQWSEALRLGDIIVRDFPNTRMAQEVRETTDALRQRAGEPAPANA